MFRLSELSAAQNEAFLDSMTSIAPGINVNLVNLARKTVHQLASGFCEDPLGNVGAKGTCKVLVLHVRLVSPATPLRGDFGRVEKLENAFLLVHPLDDVRILLWVGQQFEQEVTEPWSGRLRLRSRRAHGARVRAGAGALRHLLIRRRQRRRLLRKVVDQLRSDRLLLVNALVVARHVVRVLKGGVGDGEGLVEFIFLKPKAFVLQLDVQQLVHPDGLLRARPALVQLFLRRQLLLDLRHAVVIIRVSTRALRHLWPIR